MLSNVKSRHCVHLYGSKTNAAWTALFVEVAQIATKPAIAALRFDCLEKKNNICRLLVSVLFGP